MRDEMRGMHTHTAVEQGSNTEEKEKRHERSVGEVGRKKGNEG